MLLVFTSTCHTFKSQVLMFDITTFLAIWGAVLGTLGTIVSGILAIREFRKDRRVIHIQISLTKDDYFWIISSGRDNQADNSSPKYIVVNVYNNGFRPVQIKAICLVMVEGERLNQIKFLDNKTLPINLAENESIDAYFPTEDVMPALRSDKDRLKSVEVLDALGKTWTMNIPHPITTEILSKK